MKGTVYLVGAGPGDPGLITVKGLDLLQRADAVVYDRLVRPALLEEAPAGTERHNVGKRPGAHGMTQDEINDLLVRLALEEKTVVRLKGGDPFLFGRGGEEALRLRKEGVPFEVVPGVSAGTAAAACAGIPVTHRGTAVQCVMVTAHEAQGKPAGQVAWERLAHLDNATIVAFMGVRTLPRVVEDLLRHGKDPATPAALVASGTTSRQKTVIATLGTIVEKGKEAGIAPPALFVTGETVSLARELDWFGRRPLSGKRLVVTRARDQARALARPLSVLGAEPVLLPVIRTVPVEPVVGPGTLFGEGEWDWILFTSENGVRFFMDSLRRERLDARILAGVLIAAVGSGTANRLRLSGLEPDFVPPSFTTDSLVKELDGRVGLEGKRVLRVGPEMEPDPLVERLVVLGAEVGELRLYRIAPGSPLPEAVEDLKEEGADGCLFTSGSTVRHFFSLLGEKAALEILSAARPFAIGPVTARVLEDAGAKNVTVAREHSIPGLLRTVRDFFCDRVVNREFPS